MKRRKSKFISVTLEVLSLVRPAPVGRVPEARLPQASAEGFTSSKNQKESRL